MALAVHASVPAAGSLVPDMLRELTRRSGLADRYLALEGHRALAADEHLLPRGVRGMVEQEAAARSGSRAASLAAARSRQVIDAPPESFEAIHPRRVLVAG
jgi:hypothetical protein